MWMCGRLANQDTHRMTKQTPHRQTSKQGKTEGGGEWQRNKEKEKETETERQRVRAGERERERARARESKRLCPVRTAIILTTLPRIPCYITLTVVYHLPQVALFHPTIKWPGEHCLHHPEPSHASHPENAACEPQHRPPEQPNPSVHSVELSQTPITPRNKYCRTQCQLLCVLYQSASKRNIVPTGGTQANTYTSLLACLA